MADLSAIATIPHENISAYGDILKMLLTFLSAVGPIGSVATLVITTLTAVVLSKNKRITETNTAANEVTKKMLENAKLELDTTKRQVLDELNLRLQALQTNADQSNKELSKKFTDIQKVLGMVSIAAQTATKAAEAVAESTAKLNMTPKIDKALELRMKRLEAATANLVKAKQNGESNDV